MEKIETLLEKYIEAAIKHGQASEEGDYKTANKQYSVLDKIYNTLKKNDNLNELLKLIDHSNDHVKLWASSHTLQIEPNIAKKILLKLREGPPSVVRLDAEMILEEWEKGNLKF